MRKQFYLIILFLIIPFISLAHDFRVLVFSKTEGFRHGSIPSGIAMIEQLGLDNDFDVVSIEDAALFTFDYLKDFQAVIFLSTTGNILNDSQQLAFEQYIQNGGSYVGIHSASDTEYDWPWYGDLVGAYFDSHPAGTPKATIKVSDRVHPSTEMLPFSWDRTDEWYNYRTNPRGKVHVLATLEEKSYSGGNMGWDHPIAWCREFDGGRSWYTGGGHTNASYDEPLFKEHVLGGIYYAVGEVTGEFDATVDDNFEVSIIDNNPSNPMSLAILPDLRVMYLERGGKVKLYNQSTGNISTVANINVDTGREDGLLGLVLDPNFENNNYVYIFYSPSGNQAKQNLSRFTFTNNQLEMSSEKILLEIPTQRQECCHSGGDLEFDKNGLLYISVGDNVNPFQSGGYTPIDERNNRRNFDSQGTSANTKDLRGKILRIKPEPNGAYSIPDGNLFTNPNEGFPEIYAMGVRNPFRISLGLDNTLFFGDVGPDAASFNSNRGPKGHDEFNKTKTSGNFGWPYCIADNKSYVDYNFASGQSGSNFNCDNPRNNSPNNSGITSLPASKPSWIWYGSSVSNEFPSFGSGGRVAMAGPIYSFDSASTSDSKFPEYYNNSIFLYEWARNWIREVKLDDQGNIVELNPFYSSLKLTRPIDMAFGPDGAMYIIEWGTGFAGDNTDARIIKVAYKNGNRVPTAIAEADPSSGVLPLTVNFNANQSFDPDISDTLTYEWDFDGDGTFDTTGITAVNTYTTLGNFNVQLKVTDNQGLFSFSNLTITAGNNAPSVTLQYPENGGFFIWGEEIDFNAGVSDVEDGSITNGTINCDEVIGIPSIGHDDHIHDLNPISNCEGGFLTQTHGEDSDNVFYVFRSTYTDKGGNGGVNSITSSSTSILQPKKKEAEHYSSQQGIQIEDTFDTLGGGKNIGFINANDYLSFEPINLKNITHITFRSSSNTNGGSVEVRIDSPQGPLLGERLLPSTGGWQIWDYFSMPIQDPGGTHELFFVFKGAGSDFLFNLNWIEFHGKGIAVNDIYAFNGLKASYYNSNDFSGVPIVKKDPLVAFNWEDRAPIPNINANDFSVKWEGSLVVDETGDYSLFTKHKGNLLRLTLNGQQLINETNSGEATSSVVSLNAGQKYPILIEYTHNNGDAAISLGWGNNDTVYMSNLNIDEVLGTSNTLNKPNVKVYPNPVDNYLHLTLINDFELDVIKLYSITGALVKEWEIKKTGSTTNKLEVSRLQSGVYFLSIVGPNNIIYEKIIKK